MVPIIASVGRYLNFNGDYLGCHRKYIIQEHIMNATAPEGYVCNPSLGSVANCPSEQQCASRIYNDFVLTARIHIWWTCVY